MVSKCASMTYIVSVGHFMDKISIDVVPGRQSQGFIISEAYINFSQCLLKHHVVCVFQGHSFPGKSGVLLSQNLILVSKFVYYVTITMHACMHGYSYIIHNLEACIVYHVYIVRVLLYPCNEGFNYCYFLLIITV